MIRRDDLQDHLRPEPACTKPTDTPSPKEPENDTVSRLDHNTEQPQPQKVTVSLADCLACSGCVTSAETVLLADHTSSIFLDLTRQCEGRVAVVMSAQSRVSIAKRRPDLDVDAVLKRRFGVVKVVDIYEARAISLLHLWTEFTSRVLSHQDNQQRCLMTSACPGWVCFVEKVHPELVPVLSLSRSPQQLAAVMCTNLGYKVATVMPCFDKKLEAARHPDTIDCVLTTGELYDLIRDTDGDFDGANIEDDIQKNNKRGNPGSASGGFLQYIIHRLERDHSYTVTCTKSTRDVCEYTATSPTGTRLQLAAIYGFNNIQNLVRKTKQGNDKPGNDKQVNDKQVNGYAFVEVMACPAGCLNGGGQLPSALASVVERKAYLDDLTRLYNQQFVEQWPEDDENLLEEYKHLLAAGVLETKFEAVKQTPTTTSAFSIKW